MDELNREDQATEETEEEMEANDVEETDEEAVDESEDEDEENAPVDVVETAKYRITGLVDKFDEQMNITGQLPIGSVQELPVAYGDKAVEEGRAEKVTE